MKAEQGIFIHYVQDELGDSTDEGMFVDISGRIYEFDVDLSANRTTLLAAYVFRDITQQCEINPRKRGSGATWAYLALQVLQDLGTASDWGQLKYSVYRPLVTHMLPVNVSKCYS